MQYEISLFVLTPIPFGISLSLLRKNLSIPNGISLSLLKKILNFYIELCYHFYINAIFSYMEFSYHLQFKIPNLEFSYHFFDNPAAFLWNFNITFLNHNGI